MSGRTRRRLLALTLAVVAAVALYASSGWWLPRWGRCLDVSEPPRRADYVMVLGGDTDTRPFVAAALVKKGYVRGVLIPKCRLSPEAQDGIMPTETELMRQVLIRRGVPQSAITILPGEVDSTFDEAQELARFLDAQPGATVAVVTTAYHTRRARAVFRNALGAERAERLYFIGAPSDGFDADDWWRSEGGFVAYLNESVKTAYYAVRY